MMNPSQKLLSVAAVCLFALGCGNPNVEKLSSGSEPIRWTEHDVLFTPDLFGGVEVGLGYGDPAAAMNLAKSDAFKSAVTAFKGSALPDQISDRSASFDQVKAGLDEMIAAAEASDTAAFQAAFDKAKAANQTLMAQEEQVVEE